MEDYLSAIDLLDREKDTGQETPEDGSEQFMESVVQALQMEGDAKDATQKGKGKGKTKKDKLDDADDRDSDTAAARKSDQLVKQARSAMEQGNYDMAASFLQQGIDADPSNRDAYRQLGKLYQKLGMTQEAMDVYNQWMTNRPTDAVPYYEQARALIGMGQLADALPYVQQFQALTDGETSSYPMAASLYHQLKMPEQEAAALSGWVSQAPGSVEAHQAMAQFYSRNGDKPGALAEYQAVVQLTPQNAAAYRDLGQAYQRMQMYGDAQAALATAMNLQPQNMNIRLQLADAYRRGGQTDPALQTYYGILQDAPDSSAAAQARRNIDRIQRALLKP
jgi:tetratricopeptide (TPR) repeat protein